VGIISEMGGFLQHGLLVTENYGITML
jgi:hypothetical protein